jgi:hypothetical protein
VTVVGDTAATSRSTGGEEDGGTTRILAPSPAGTRTRDTRSIQPPSQRPHTNWRTP